MLKLENVSKYYHNDGVVTLGLRKINLTFNIGEFIAITGESGSGKSTLLNVISGIDSYEDGELYIRDEETSHFDENDWEEYRKNSFAFIFQNYNLIDSYTVLKNVEVALVIQGLNKAARQQRAKEIIEKVGLTSHINHRASKLSGGQKQRLAIARALAKDTQIIVADEPTGNLDTESGNQVLKLLYEVSKERLVIIVTHNYVQVEPYVTRKIRLFDGEVIEDKEIKHANIQEPKPKKVFKMSKILKMLTITLFNIIGQPKKTLLLLLVSFSSVAFVILIYGFFITADIDIGYGYEDDNAYGYRAYNYYRERIIIKRKDDSYFTEEDYQKISAIKKIDSIITQDLVVDLGFVTNFKINNNLYNANGYITFDKFNETEIIGNIPTNENELLISIFIHDRDKENIEEILNQTISVRMNTKHQVYTQDFKVVGIHYSSEPRTKFVISDVQLENIYQLIKINNNDYKVIIKHEGNDLEIRYSFIHVNHTLTGNQISVQIFGNEVYDTYLDGIKVENVRIIGVGSSLHVSEELYNQLKIYEDYQYTANLKNPKDAQRVINKLFDLGYYSFSPFSHPTGEDIGYAMLRSIMLLFLSASILFSLFVVFIISYLIIKAILATKSRDYTILRTIGIEKNTIKHLITFELIAYFLVSYLIFLSIYGILMLINPVASGSLYQGNIILYNMMSEYSVRDFLLVTIINLAIGLLISKKFIKHLSKNNIFSSLRVGE